MVATPPPRSSRNASGGIRYLTEGTAHDGSDKPRSWYVGGLDCAPETAADEWRAVRQRFGKDGVRSRRDEHGREVTEGTYVQAVHVVLSYDTTEYDPSDPEGIRKAHEQSREVAERIRDGHQVVMATQTDGLGSDGVGKVHTHIYINAVHPETGRSANGRHHAKDINRLRRAVDAVSLEHGRDNAALMAERDRSVRRRPEEIAQKAAGEYVWKDDLTERLDRSLSDSTSREDWRTAAEAEGVEIVYRGRTGVSYRFTDEQGEERRVRARDLGSRWTARNIDADLDRNLQRVQAQQVPVVEAEDAWDFEVLEPTYKTKNDEQEQKHVEHEHEESRGGHAGVEREGGHPDRRAAEHEAGDQGRTGVARPRIDLAAVRQHVAADRERREQTERDREHAQRVRAESRREALERSVAELGRGSAEESRGYGLGD